MSLLSSRHNYEVPVLRGGVLSVSIYWNFSDVQRYFMWQDVLPF
jgi:hypothetical protein